MSKVLYFLALCCLLLVQIQGQALTDREYCIRLNRDCLLAQPSVGAFDDTSTVYNTLCRTVNPNWRNISRCQLLRAACELTLIRCANLTCPNVAAVLRG